MDYISAINQFWRLNNVEKFTPYEVNLYFYLLDRWNQSQHKNPIKKPTLSILSEIKISKVIFYKARNVLRERGLIEFSDGGRHELPEYKLIGLDNGEYEKAKPREKPKICERAQELQGELFGERKMAKTSGKRKKEEFIPPSVDELERYFANRGVEGAKEKAELFWNHYDSIGWRIASGAKIWRWDSLANKWLLNEKRKGKRDGTNRGSDKKTDGYKQVLQQRFEDADRKWKKENGVS